jgi:DnaK suppressor protein
MLSQSDISKFQTQFLSRQKEILAQLQSSDFIDHAGDEYDAAQALQAKITADSLTKQLVQQANQISKSLQKIKDGTFGLCQECEEPIAIKRLQAQPFAILCISCAEEKEMMQKKYATL